jgi:hypothetical protein|tara:strand:+ start:417 stop:566 length:150 start_codon:yes stop_codon:yes gene_type:complete
MIEVTAEEVVQAFKDRYPTEFELCVLLIQNIKMQQQLAVDPDNEDEESE